MIISLPNKSIMISGLMTNQNKIGPKKIIKITFQAIFNPYIKLQIFNREIKVNNNLRIMTNIQFSKHSSPSHNNFSNSSLSLSHNNLVISNLNKINFNLKCLLITLFNRAIKIIFNLKSLIKIPSKIK